MYPNKGVMVARYRPLDLPIIVFVSKVAFLGVYDHCVKKNPTPYTVPINIYLKYYVLDCIFCTVFTRVTGYNPPL